MAGPPSLGDHNVFPRTVPATAGPGHCVSPGEGWLLVSTIASAGGESLITAGDGAGHSVGQDLEPVALPPKADKATAPCDYLMGVKLVEQVLVRPCALALTETTTLYPMVARPIRNGIESLPVLAVLPVCVVVVVL